MTPIETEILKRTEVGDAAVLTVRRAGPFLLRPVQTFAVVPASRYAQRLIDPTCVSVALHQHDELLRSLMSARNRRPSPASR